MSCFTVTLPSNSLMNYYEDNTVAQSTTKLAQTIELDGDWEVGLSSISVPTEVENAIAKQCYCNTYYDDVLRWTVTLPPGHYYIISHESRYDTGGSERRQRTYGDMVRKRLYPIKPKSHKWKYEVGDRVRIAMQKRPFRKGYLGDWSHEIFEIKSRLSTVPVTYELVDLAGESLKGSFYNHELQKVTKSDDEHFDIDGILRTRKRSNGRVEYLVALKGYPSKFNS